MPCDLSKLSCSNIRARINDDLHLKTSVTFSRFLLSHDLNGHDDFINGT